MLFYGNIVVLFWFCFTLLSRLFILLVVLLEHYSFCPKQCCCVELISLFLFVVHAEQQEK